MTVGSLFAGIGGLDLGFEWAGFDVRWQVEQNLFCLAVLAKHWPNVVRYTDVRTVGAHNLDPVDLVVGGFPCQDISDAGLRAGIDGARSGLWTQFARIIRELRPRGVVVENVAGLFVRGFDRVLGDLAALGYDAEWSCLRAADVGAPHRRERVFIVAQLADAGHVQRSGRTASVRSDWRQSSRGQSAPCGAVMADAGHDGRMGSWQSEPAGQQGSRGAEPDGCRDGRAGSADVALAVCTGHEGLGSAGSDWWGQSAAFRPDGRTGTRWPARPGEPQHAWEPPRVLRRAESGMGVVPDGVSAGLVRHRRRALEALGNAVVPQVAYVVACRALAILESV